LLTDGDRLRFTAAATPNIRRFRQIGASYQAPIGSSGLTASGSVALVHTRAKEFDLQGRARVAQLALTYPLIRTFRKAADVGVMLDGVNSDNALFGNVISSDRVRTVRALGSYASATKRDKLQAQLILSRGLGIFGARVNPLLSTKAFLKASAAVSYERELSARLIGRATALGQYSRDRLPASELFAVGGASAGRAFDTALLSGDRGYGAVGELAYRPVGSGAFAKSELYAYADGAKVAFVARAGYPTQHYGLASSGIGARARWKDKIELGIEAGRVLDKPYPTYDEKWRLSFNYRLTL
jgi:hemolysin activation/secretion protein